MTSFDEVQLRRMQMLCPLCQPVSGATGKCTCTQICASSFCAERPMDDLVFDAPVVPRFRRAQ